MHDRTLKNPNYHRYEEHEQGKDNSFSSKKNMEQKKGGLVLCSNSSFSRSVTEEALIKFKAGASSRACHSPHLNLDLH